MLIHKKINDGNRVMTRPDGEFTTTPKEALNIVLDTAFLDSESVPHQRENVTRLQNGTLGEFTYA